MTTTQTTFIKRLFAPKRLSAVALGAVIGIGASYAVWPLPQTQMHHIKLPPGFHLEVYAQDVTHARSITMGKNGTLYVGTGDQGGSVYAIPDNNHDGKADRVVKLATDLYCPNGVEYRKGSLYVGEVNRVLRFDNVDDAISPDGQVTLSKPVVINDSFPLERWHGNKYIRFGPDNWLYIPVGAPCNVCKQKDKRYATIMRMKEDGSNVQIFAAGIRNSVGFDWHPRTGELWFTDNGRDWLGDDRPPDELNHAPQQGMHFGFPFRHGKDIVDPEFGQQASPPPTGAPKGIPAASAFTPCAVELGPHVASLGMKFYTGKMFPDAWGKDSIFICEHGSWNRSKPIGYRITRINLANPEAPVYQVFAEGWRAPNGVVWGRPVDLLVAPDGSLFVSDDHGHAIYRISYQ